MSSVERKAVVLGSFKNGAWNSVVEAVDTFRNAGVNVLSPSDTRRTDISINDGDFYYLQSDLERVGKTQADLLGLSQTAIAVALGFVPLQRDVLKNILHMGSHGYVYLATPFSTLGKSSAHELVIASLTGKKLAVSAPIEVISEKVHADTRDFLEESLLPQIPIVTLEELKASSDIASHFVSPQITTTPSEAYHLFRIAVYSLLRTS